MQSNWAQTAKPVRYNARTSAEGVLILAFEESLPCLPSCTTCLCCSLSTMPYHAVDLAVPISRPILTCCFRVGLTGETAQRVGSKTEGIGSKQMPLNAFKD